MTQILDNTAHRVARDLAHRVAHRVADEFAHRVAFLALGAGTVMLTACGSSESANEFSPADVSQTVEFTAAEYTFGADSSTVIGPGEVVRFRLTNVGALNHEMRVLDGRGRMIDSIEPLAPGDVGEVLLSFDEAGQYQLICDIDDHLSRGQRAVFSVNDSVAD